MYLSRLDLHGFKSFAQKTSVAFSPGVTAIVGPNGCGKSNIIDAVRWVLGEQRSRLLRSDSMAGVLFNGSAGKRALGMAEVSLTVENNRGVLPTEYSEVTITRRLFRSGDSEYLLNGTSCRLRDIMDLFMDTGMGAGAYSVIELSMVEDILSDNADDRRRLFEEAAGITKYKRRREQALRKLANTQSDLTRLDDIIDEVDRSVKALQRQAQKASRHQRFATRLRHIELALTAHDYFLLQEEREVKADQRQVTGDEVEGLSARISTAEAKLEEARTALVGMEHASSDRQAALHAHAQSVGALEAELRLGAERLSSSQRALERIEREQLADANRTVSLEGEEAAARKALSSGEQAVATAAAALADATTRRDATVTAAESARQALAEARSRAGQAQQAARDARAARDRAADRREMQASEAARVDTQLATLAERRGALGDLDALKKASAATEAALADANEALEQAATAVAEARASAEAAESDRQAARSSQRAAEAEVGLLKNLLAAGDSSDAAVAFVTSQPESSAVTVAEIIGCDDADKLAVDAALGPWAKTLVVESETDAAAAIASLSSADQGRATFLGLDRFKAHPPPTPLAAPTGTTPLLNVARPASAAYAPLLQALLGSVFLAESLEDALRLRDKHPAARFVTRGGAWADASGALHGGSAKASAGAGRLGFRERLSRAESALEAAQKALAKADATAATAVEKRVQAETRRAEADRARDAARDARESGRAALARLQTETEGLTRQIEQLALRRAEIESALAEQLNALELDAAVETTASEAEQSEAARAEAESVYESADTERRAAESAWGDARIASAQAQAVRQSAIEQLARLEQTRADLARRAGDRDAEMVRIRATISDTDKGGVELRESLDAKRHETDALTRSAEAAETAVRESRAGISDIEKVVRETRSARESAQNVFNALELRLAEINTRQETLLERLADEHGADIDDADEQLDALKAEDAFDPADARREVPKLREQIRGLGAINELALEDFEEQQERLEFLQAQRADLQGAENTLRETIQEINDTARARFDSTFTQIREAFQKLFTELFGGEAAADVTLDGDDPLEAPVVITARPSGKRPVSIAQLSGGEKTLTATALLFAIYLVKPSPFCILDEVDAPLDDANVTRFMRLIRSFSESTQFILVTHNKLTMEAADRMYGVTMPTPGISRLVGVRFDEDGDGAVEVASEESLAP